MKGAMMGVEKAARTGGGREVNAMFVVKFALAFLSGLVLGGWAAHPPYEKRASEGLMKRVLEDSSNVGVIALGVIAVLAIVLC